MSSTDLRFNPNEHLMQIGYKDKAKDYLPVQWRLVWFREAFPQGSIETEMLHLDLDRDTEDEAMMWNAEKRRNEKVIKQAKGFVIFKATVKDGIGGVAVGTKSEKAASFPDYIEKAETGAIGRALAALGYGTQFAPELDEGNRIVDAPVEPSSNASRSRQNGASEAVSPIPINGKPDTQMDYLRPSEVEKLKSEWVEARDIQPNKVAELWVAFKAYIADGPAMADDRITRVHEKRMRDYLTSKKQNKAS